MFNKKDDWAYDQAFAYVKCSKNWEQFIRILATNRKTPSEITKAMDKRFSLISRLLANLK